MVEGSYIQAPCPSNGCFVDGKCFSFNLNGVSKWFLSVQPTVKIY